jgi:paraquat-inducible protein B
LAPASLLQGAIQFDLPEEDRANPVLPAGATLTLFDDQSAAQQGAPGPAIPYAVLLHGDAGDIESGSPVTLQGYQIGKVDTVKLCFDGQGAPYTLATIRLYANKLNVGSQTGREATDAAVSRLLHLGYRARLGQTPPFIGAHSIVLSRGNSRQPAMLLHGAGPYPVLPAVDGKSANVDDILLKVDQIVSKINRMPLEQIGHNVQSLTANVRDITAQAKPRVGPLLDRLNATASGLDGAAQAARSTLTGEGANQGEGLPDAIRQMNEMARSIRALTDYLGRHPEALIRGKAKEKAK